MPCVKNGKSCSRDCRCKECQNRDHLSVTSNSQNHEKRFNCTCGRSGKLGKFSCSDESKKMKSRCPCLKHSEKCSESTCRCTSCCNPFGMNQNKFYTSHSLNRKGNEIKSFKRKRASTYLEESGVKVLQGGWNNNENVLLAVILRMTKEKTIVHSSENIHKLYNWTIDSLGDSSKLDFRRKSITQIAGKLYYIKRLTTFYG